MSLGVVVAFPMGSLVNSFATTTLEGKAERGPVRSSHLGNQIFVLRLPLGLFVKFDFFDARLVHPCRSLKVVLGLDTVAIYRNKDTSEWHLAPLGFAGRSHSE